MVLREERQGLEKRFFELAENSSSFFSRVSDNIHFYLIGGYVFDLLPSLKFTMGKNQF